MSTSALLDLNHLKRMLTCLIKYVRNPGPNPAPWQYPTKIVVPFESKNPPFESMYIYHAFTKEGAKIFLPIVNPWTCQDQMVRFYHLQNRGIYNSPTIDLCCSRRYFESIRYLMSCFYWKHHSSYTLDIQVRLCFRVFGTTKPHLPGMIGGFGMPMVWNTHWRISTLQGIKISPW